MPPDAATVVVPESVEGAPEVIVATMSPVALESRELPLKTWTVG